ncbi:hypothetical protein [uncultured Microbacterium sp.]|uniref:Aminoglycoside-2''-adenylyltransferase n=1 Tax=uncultured Microbacterium sp. TaxID=191216 RepID=A0A1Y5P6Z6_9MICO|nr:hypothetical protein [uncultured Microbacterium sp.]SBS71708.1 conserved hypothetical protein [uncultured Microbacterium sp.]
MASPAPTPATRWDRLAPDAVAEIFAGTSARWWLSGGAALDRWLGAPIRERANTDVSTTSRDLAPLVEALPAGFSAWAPLGDDDLVPFADAPADADLQPVRIHDDEKGAWVLQVNIEDGTDRAWLYRRDPRLQLPWDRAVLDIDGIPTGAPEVQLVWKALRPRPEDETDKDAVLPTLSEEARAFFETALLRIHPHSTWAIHVRSPLTPAKASWNRRKA